MPNIAGNSGDKNKLCINRSYLTVTDHGQVFSNYRFTRSSWLVLEAAIAQGRATLVVTNEAMFTYANNSD